MRLSIRTRMNSLPSRRSFLTQILAAGVAPCVVPAHVLRAQTAPSNKITLGVLGTGSQGIVDMRAFLNHDGCEDLQGFP